MVTALSQIGTDAGNRAGYYESIGRPQANYNYRWEDDGKGGVNYYRIVDDGSSSTPVPITREEFAKNTGEDIGGIENWVKGNYDSSNKSAETDPAITNGTGGTGTGSIGSRQVVGPDGGIYDLNTPAGAEAYKAAKDNWVNTEYSNKMGEFNTSLARGKQDLSTQQNAYKTAKDRFYGVDGQPGSYQKGINDLNMSKDQRDSGTLGYFLNKGANVYQSAEGDAMKQSQNIYNEGMQSADQQKQDTETNFNTFDTQIKRTAEDLAKQAVDTPRYYDNWKAQNLAQDTVDVNTAKQNISNYYKSTTTPTFQDKAFDISNYYAKLADNPYLSDSIKSSLLSKAGSNLGVNVGQDSYNIYKQLDQAVQNNDQAQIDELNKKLYGTQY